MQGQIVKATQEWASLLTNVQWQKVLRVAPRWLALLMVILLARSAAQLTWLVFTPSVQNAGGVQGFQPTRNHSVTPVRLRSVSDLHLFGVASKQVPEAAAVIDAKKTHLKLTLRGVFAAEEPSKAMAIIADERGNEKVYLKGQTIFSGVKLYAVYPDRVILERSGNFESLVLPRDEDNAAAKGVRIVRPAAHTDRNLPVVSRTVQGGEELDALRNQLLHDPQKFWQNVRIEPRYGSNNQIIGYSFFHDDQKMMQAMGLRKGDIIVEVNGEPVSDPSVLTSLMGQLSTATSFTLGIERNGQRENLNITM